MGDFFPNLVPRVTIHSPTLRPLVDELGQDIEPAKATNFAIEKVKLCPAFSVEIKYIICQVNILTGARALGYPLLP